MQSQISFLLYVHKIDNNNKKKQTVHHNLETKQKPNNSENIHQNKAWKSTEIQMFTKTNS